MRQDTEIFVKRILIEVQSEIIRVKEVRNAKGSIVPVLEQKVLQPAFEKRLSKEVVVFLVCRPDCAFLDSLFDAEPALLLLGELRLFLGLFFLIGLLLVSGLFRIVRILGRIVRAFRGHVRLFLLRGVLFRLGLVFLLLGLPLLGLGRRIAFFRAAGQKRRGHRQRQKQRNPSSFHVRSPFRLSLISLVFRVYLKTHDVTGSEGFLRCARHFFAGILTYFKEK